MNIEDKKYVVVVQCHIVKESCSGFICEHTFNEKADMFSNYSTATRFLPITCGGCCGRAIHRKLSELLKAIKRKDKYSKDDIAVHLSSCITKDNHHGPPCPHKEYLKNIIQEKLGLDLIEGTYISKAAEKRRISEKYH